MSDQPTIPEDPQEQKPSHFPLWFWLILGAFLFLVMYFSRSHLGPNASRTFDAVGKTIGR
jgi:hypothetical protein